MRLSSNEKKLLGLIYKNYLDNCTKEYILHISSPESIPLINAVRAFERDGLIAVSDNFNSHDFSLSDKIAVEITDAGIDLAQKLNL